MAERPPGPSGPVDFVGDDALAYNRNRYRGGRLELDRAYRLMHLPLVDPRHSDVLPESEDGEVAMGRFKLPRKSLVAFINWAQFERAAHVATMIDQVAARAFGRKIDFASFNRRKDRLHFTISPLRSEDEVGRVFETVRSKPQFLVRVGNLWAGASVNTGRFYLPVYPERGPDGNVVNTLQAEAGLPQSDFFGLGFFNLVDHLSEAESADLLAFIDAISDQALFIARVDELAVIETADSLLLDYRILHRIGLS